MTDKQQQLINRLASNQCNLDYYTKERESLKRILLPYLPGYIEPGTVLQRENKKEWPYGYPLIRIESQEVEFVDGKWAVESSYVTGLIHNRDDQEFWISFDEIASPTIINDYHPEEVTGE